MTRTVWCEQLVSEKKLSKKEEKRGNKKKNCFYGQLWFYYYHRSYGLEWCLICLTRARWQLASEVTVRIFYYTQTWLFGFSFRVLKYYGSAVDLLSRRTCRILTLRVTRLEIHKSQNMAIMEYIAVISYYCIMLSIVFSCFFATAKPGVAYIYEFSIVKCEVVNILNLHTA